jgi:DNA-binding SARP family transcriptional activator
MLRVCLFGQPCFFWREQPLKFSAPPKALPLLGYLLIHGDRPVERLYLASLLWPESSEADARTNLRRHLHHLNSFLPEPPAATPWLLTNELTIQWNPAAPAWLDVAEFERLCGLPGQLADAVALYTGDFLETLYDDWIIIERERLREHYFGALFQLALASRACCNYVQASVYTARLLARDPLQEDTLRLHIALHYQAGDRAGAIQAYEKFQRLLRQELGVEPMPETQAVAEAILRNRPLPVAVPSGAAESAGCEGVPRRMTLPFVGRTGELAQLQAAWQRAAQHLGGLVWVSGEAGIGKTRLVNEFAQQVGIGGGRVLYGSARPASGEAASGESEPYHALREALLNALPLVAAVETEPLWLAALAVLIPELHQRRTLPALPRLDAESERRRLFEALGRTLSELARPRPLLLILEDLHWAGKATLALLNQLIHRCAQDALLVVITYREEEITPAHPLRQQVSAWQKERRGELVAEPIALKRLPAEAIGELLRPLRLAESVSVELAQRLAAESEGNPLFIDLLLQQWAESGEQMLPSGLPGVIQQRLAHLSEPARALAEVAAVTGPAFDFDLVRDVGGWDSGFTLDALSELLDRRLVCEAAGRGRFDYLFNHHLIQVTLYENIPAAKRSRRHRRVAQVMEALYPQQADDLAAEVGRHYELGAEPRRAAACYLRTARRSLALYADDEALAALGMALSLATADWPPAERYEIVALREAIYARRGERQPQRIDLEELERLSDAAGDPERVCDALKRRVLFHRALGERPAEIAAIERLESQALGMGSLHWQAEALQLKGCYTTLVNDYPTAANLLQQSLALYQQLGDRSGQVGCFCDLAEIAIQLRRNNEADAYAQQALALGNEQEQAEHLLHILWLVAAAQLAGNNLEACLAAGHKLLALAERTGDRNWEAAAHNMLGHTESILFRIQSARQHLDQAMEIYGQIQKLAGQRLVLTNLGFLALTVGRFDEAELAYQQAMSIGQQLGGGQNQLYSYLNLACVAEMRGDHAAEKECSEQALLLARQVNNHFLEAHALNNLAGAERKLNFPELALPHAQEAAAIFLETEHQAEYASALRELALIHLAVGDLPAASRTVDELVALYPAIRDQTDEPQRFLWAAACVRHASGQPDLARELINQAYAVFGEKLANIPDAESQSAYRQIPYNPQVLAAYERDEWGD